VRHAARPTRAELAHIEGDVELEILNVHPGKRSTAFGRRERRDRVEEGGFGDEDHVRPPEHFANQGRKAGEREARGIERARESSRLRRDPDGTPRDVNAPEGLRLVEPRSVRLLHLPKRIIGWWADDAHLVTLAGEPLAHLAREGR